MNFIHRLPQAEIPRRKLTSWICILQGVNIASFHSEIDKIFRCFYSKSQARTEGGGIADRIPGGDQKGRISFNANADRERGRQ